MTVAFIGFGLFVLSIFASVVGTRAALRLLKRRQILDTPNERSSHTLPTPRGLGLGVVPVVVAGWLVVLVTFPHPPREAWVVVGAAIFLAVLSWVDDLKNISAALRLVAQLACVVLAVWAFEPPTLAHGHLSPLAARAVTALLWVGLVNQVNFTDGVDGNLGALLVCVGLGLFGVTVVGGHGHAIGALALVIAGAAAGFLPLNWSPAKAFMGDVGSVPIGYMLAWLLLRFASDGYWMPAIILPMVYFVDTAVTYGGRLARREHFWHPHRLYAYQRAARTKSHAHVVGAIVVCNLALLAIGLAAARTGARGWLVVAFVVALLGYGYLARAARADSPGEQHV